MKRYYVLSWQHSKSFSVWPAADRAALHCAPRRVLTLVGSRHQFESPTSNIVILKFHSDISRPNQQVIMPVVPRNLPPATHRPTQSWKDALRVQRRDGRRRMGRLSQPSRCRTTRPIVRFTSHVGATTEKERKAREKEESIRGNATAILTGLT